MGRRLATFVHAHLYDSDGLVTETQVFGPDDEVPAKFAKGLGDHVWENGDDESDSSDLDGDGKDDAHPDQPAGNASLEAWQEFAATQGVDVEGLSRNDIRDQFRG